MASLKNKIAQALLKHTWEDGYDRDESHNRGEHVAYKYGLEFYFENSAEIWADELAEAVIACLKKERVIG